MMHRIIGALCVISCATSACSSPTSPVDAGALRRAEARWAARDFDSYSYETVTSCGLCSAIATRLTRVDVRSGSVAAVTVVANDSLLSTTAAYSTVDGLFARIRAYQRDDGLQEVKVEYDPLLGYPTQILVFAKAGIEDGSYGIYNSRLRSTRAQ